MATDAIISVVVDQLFIIINDQFQELRAVLGVEKEIKNLSSKLKKIREVLDDAERRSFKEKGVKLWVEEIQDLCYDVEDVVDEWNTRSRRQQIAAAPARSSWFSSSCFHFKRYVMNRDIALKIKKLDSRLDGITKEKDQFNFVYASPSTVTHTHASDHEQRRVATTPFDVEASEIQGRKSDASDVIRELLKNGSGEEKEEARNGPSVISIVGQGGIGKTTLAQLVYGDEQIKTHFHERVWVCVSNPFDQIKIAQAIVESITKSSTNLSHLSVLLEKIQNILSHKRFLIVLDDVWTEEDAMWAPFKNCLKVGLPGSRILVTSRSERVARMMASEYQHRVELISDTDAWLLLSRIAFSGRRDDAYSEKLKDVGQKIAQKCQGLPLAVKVMGSLLRCKDTEEEWQDVLSKLDTKVWELEQVGTHLYPHLYLSYDDLTPQMKRCFSYCAIFPKDYTIGVDELIKIWMAQGYLTTTKGTSDQNQMELKGREVFESLAMRSLFQNLEKDEMDFAKKVDRDPNIVHDIVHDFVKFLTKNEYDSVGGHEKNKNLRHLSWRKTRGPMNPASICDIGKLRSFYAENLSPEQLSQDLFKGLKSVRVLRLHGCTLQKLPKKIGDLFHLRYIDLSCSKVEELPDSICSLVNLQTLDLEGCECLSRLPDSICSLDNLRTLDLGGCECLSRLPDSICSLDNLQTLFLGGFESLSRLPDSICSLDNLQTLDLGGCDCLSTLPDSICFLYNLQTLCLRECECLSRLPDSICSLDNLQTLFLGGCENLSRLPDSICFLDNLQTLCLRECECLSRLPDSICSLDNLQTLRLGGCECLSRLPDSICSLDNLQSLWLRGCECLSRLPDSVCSLNNLKTLDLKGYEYLSRLPEGIENMHQLRLIDLRGCKVELPDSIYSLNNLEIRDGELSDLSE